MSNYYMLFPIFKAFHHHILMHKKQYIITRQSRDIIKYNHIQPL
jgi:hypothetical protein